MPYLTLMTAVNYFEQSANLPATIEVFCKFAFRLTFAFIVLKALTFSLMTLDRQDRVFRPFSPRITQSKVKTDLGFIPADCCCHCHLDKK